MDSTRAATLNVLAQAAVDSAIPVDPIEGVDGGLTVRVLPHRTAYPSFANDGVSALLRSRTLASPCAISCDTLSRAGPCLRTATRRRKIALTERANRNSNHEGLSGRSRRKS